MNYASLCFLLFFFFNDTAPTEIYTLSLHDALPILGHRPHRVLPGRPLGRPAIEREDRKSTRLNSTHSQISYAVFCLKKREHSPGGRPAHGRAGAAFGDVPNPAGL